MIKITIKEIINSKSADDDSKGNKVFEKIRRVSKNDNEEIILDFDNIELVNTAFLNNAIGQLFNRDLYDISKNTIKIANMQSSMKDLLRESIAVANAKYS